MAKVNAKQRKILLLELQTSACACRIHIDSPDDMLGTAAHKQINDILRISRLLLDEISIHEFLVGIRDSGFRKYYQELIEGAASPSQYKKKGYGPMHGKVGPKKKNK